MKIMTQLMTIETVEQTFFNEDESLIPSSIIICIHCSHQFPYIQDHLVIHLQYVKFVSNWRDTTLNRCSCKDLKVH